MRITPVILIALGIWGLVQPEMLSTLEAGQGRMLSLIIFLLGIFSLWRSLRRR